MIEAVVNKTSETCKYVLNRCTFSGSKYDNAYYHDLSKPVILFQEVNARNIYNDVSSCLKKNTWEKIKNTNVLSDTIEYIQ